MPRSIVHLDADAFFASVEQASNPSLRGKPIAVGGEKRGIVASASYEARKAGIYTPMPTSRARKLCPNLIVVPGDFEKYEQFSKWMFSYAYDFTPDVEISSIDEGYFDLTGARKSPIEVAATIRKAIRETLKINVSEGLAANKLVSQIAAKVNKPSAFVEIAQGKETALLHPLPNHWLPGIGPHTAQKLNAAGLARIGQLAETPIELLAMLLGKQAADVRQFAHGIDERPVIPMSVPAKSYGHQETFNTDTTDEEYVEATLRRMADSLMAKIREERKCIRTISVKVRYNDMDEEQRSDTLLEPTDLETDIYGRITWLLKQAWSRRVSLRLVALKLSNVYDAFFRSELALEERSQQQEARRRLAAAVDYLNDAHASRVVFRGHDFVLRDAPREPAAARPLQPPKRIRLVVRKTSEARATYTPLQTRSYYSFLNSTLSVQAIVELARKHGLRAVGICDPNLHGAVEFVKAAQSAGIKPIIGAEVWIHGEALHLYVENTQGYWNLCKILTLSAQTSDDHSNTPEWLGTSTAGLIATSRCDRFADFFPNRFYYEATPGEKLTTAQAARAIAAVPMHYAARQDRLKFDVAQSIRTLTLLKQPHPEKTSGRELHFRSPVEMAVLYQDFPEALNRTNELADRCNVELPFGKPQFPAFTPPNGKSPREFLRELVLEGLVRRYGPKASQRRAQVEEELAIIHEVGYEEYFLAVWDILQECKRRGIDWITRGSAADSLVCYCLGISDVCPIRFELYFRRFLNKDRMLLDKLPDIDLDFPHDRKDDVINLIFEKHGNERVAVVGGFSTYQARSAIADVAKALGVSEQEARRFTKRIQFHRPTDMAEKITASLESRDLPIHEDPYKTTLEIAEFLDQFPRYAKMHPCGVVVSREPMSHLTPCFVSDKGYPTTHFDMEAVEQIGLIKMDILAQGGLAVMRDVKHWLNARGVDYDLAALEPWKDEQVWEMIASGGARAVHHIESPAMISLCRMCNVRDIDGLVAIVSVIRPGAANEHKKVSFTRRYQGLEPSVYPHPSLEPCLRSTFGMVVYEEHILQICEVFAGLNGGRADVLRRALNKEKQEVIAEIHPEFVASARLLGRSDEDIANVWELVTSFRGYAFCKAHSAAYGVEAYQSAWLKCYFPVEFMAAVLTNGKGFYHPLVYVLECHRLGIKLLGPCVNEPGPQFTPKDRTIRPPVTRIKGLSDKTKARILKARQMGPFSGIADFYKRTHPLPEEMDLLHRAGAFDGFGDSRSAQFWQMQFLLRAYGHDRNAAAQGLLFPDQDKEKLPEVPLEEPTKLQRLQWESELFDFPVTGHPLELHPNIAWETYCPIAELAKHCGEEVVVCGLIIEERIHHEATGEPMKFLTIADWSGMVETELFAKTYKTYGLATIRYPVLEITATVEAFENGRGHTLRALRAAKPRMRR
ncbi:MAG TPA: DNA polymerase IV [Methylomirabilota bacterium]|nr:DNA polymerase IV [Methylomirabilota bacterium]